MRDESTRPDENTENPGVFGDAGALRKQHKERKPGRRRWITLAALVLVAGLAVGGVLLADRIPPPQPEPTAEPPASTARSPQRSINRPRSGCVTIPSREASIQSCAMIVTG